MGYDGRWTMRSGSLVGDERYGRDRVIGPRRDDLGDLGIRSMHS